MKPNDVRIIPISHGEGQFVATESQIHELASRGQIATQYVGMDNRATMNMPDNPNGSAFAVEGITSPDGRIFGKMGHSERIGKHLYKNVIGDYEQKIFESGVKYFTHKK
jgi:phosphoribosylformylglycinamidine synthase